MFPPVSNNRGLRFITLVSLITLAILTFTVFLQNNFFLLYYGAGSSFNFQKLREQLQERKWSWSSGVNGNTNNINNFLNDENEAEITFSSPPPDNQDQSSINIALVNCNNKTLSDGMNETIGLVKSVFIAAHLYKVEREVKLFILTNLESIAEYLFKEVSTDR